jgi:dTDP-4-dehydrorhamnose 3,5-epimerase
MIPGALVTPLARITTPSGDVLHGLKVSAPGYVGFGEAYFSQIHEGAIKHWRRHSSFTLNLVVPVGNVRFVIFDDRGGAHEFSDCRIGELAYARLTVAPGLWLAFQGLGPGTSLILSIIDGEHDPEESATCELAAIAYAW